MKFKLKDLLDKVRIGIGVARIVTGGAHSKIFDKLDEGTAIADKAKEIADMVKAMQKKK